MITTESLSDWQREVVEKARKQLAISWDFTAVTLDDIPSEQDGFTMEEAVKKVVVDTLTWHGRR